MFIVSSKNSTHVDEATHKSVLALLLDDDGSLQSLGDLAEEDVVAVASQQQVLFSLAKRVLHNDRESYISLAGKHYLDDLWSKQRNRVQQCLVQLHELTALLNAVGVTPLYFKGAAALLQQWYLSPEERFFLDIDVLLKPEDIQTSNKALQQAGYSPSSATVRVGHHHLPGLKHEHRPLSVEIHSQPLPARAGFWLMADDVFEQATIVQSSNESFDKYLLPSFEHSLILSVVTNEVCEYGLNTGRVNLKHALDAMALWENTKDVPERYQTLVDRFISMLLLLRSEENIPNIQEGSKRLSDYKRWLLSKSRWRFVLHYIIVHASVDYLQRRYDDYSHRKYLYFCCKETLYALSAFLRKLRVKYLSH